MLPLSLYSLARAISALSLLGLSAGMNPHPTKPSYRIDSIPLTPGATRTTITYGPFHVGAESMYPHTPLRTEAKPCTDCYLLMMETTLEDLHGTPLGMSDGIWLHHLMQFNLNQTDLVCPDLYGHYFYGSGNERPIWRLNGNGHGDEDWGYYVHPDDEWMTAVEIMNESPEARDVQVSVTYEWVSREHGVGYRDAELVWVNIGPPCGNGEIPAEPGRTVYMSDEWVSTVSGPILEARGHMHDGGQAIALFVNGDVVCESKQWYGGRAGYSTDGVDHLSGASACHGGRIEKGDRLQIVAVFDEGRYPIMKHHGATDEIMAVMFMYVGVEV